MQLARIKRRDFIWLAGSATVWPAAALGQPQGGMRRVGVLMSYAAADPAGLAFVAAFREAMQKLGWTEERNVLIDTRWGTTARQSLQRSAQELVETQPDVILAANSPSTAALLQHTRTIPIVFTTVGDPVGSGFVASFPRPGGNVTGFTNLEPTMAGKWLQLLTEIAPQLVRVAAIFNPTSVINTDIYLDPFKAAAASLRIEGILAPVQTASELDRTLAAQARTPNGGLVVMPGAFTTTYRAEITALAARYNLPAAYPYRTFPEVGGLLSYGSDIRDNYRRAAAYVDRILKGTRPSELPVQAPVKFELVLNMKAAKALGLDVPWQLQQLANEVIE